MGDVDGIIVLSGAEDPLGTLLWDQVGVGGAAERDLMFMALAKRYPEAKLIFTGGAGSMIHQEYPDQTSLCVILCMIVLVG